MGKEKLGISLVMTCEEKMKIDYTIGRLLLDFVFSSLPEMPKAKFVFLVDSSLFREVPTLLEGDSG